MSHPDKNCYAKNPHRAAFKIAVIVLSILIVCVLLALKANDPALDQLKFNLSLERLIGLVVVINIASMACIAGLYAAYRWVRSDLKAPRSEDQPEDLRG